MPRTHRNCGGSGTAVSRRAGLGAWVVALGLAMLSVVTAASAATTFSPRVDVASQVDIRMASWLESLPSTGFVPVKVHIRNGSAQAHTWTVTSNSSHGGMGGGVKAGADLTVEAGRAGERVFYAPVALQASSGHSYGALNFGVSGFGVSPGGAGTVTSTSGHGSGRTEFIGMSKMLTAKHWSGLRAKISSTGRSGSGATRSELNGSEVDIATAPDDWRGYSGLAQLWMDESEWLNMRPAAKVAMLDWVAMGGRAYVLASEDSDARAKELDLPRKMGDMRRHGLGAVMLMPWNGTSMSLDEMARQIRSSDVGGLRTQFDGYNKPWGLRALAGELSLKSGLIFGFIAIFGILVGPVNLFWLAPAGKRQRMFWTTPLLSLGGSLLLVVIMLLQDGIGGNGARLTLAILQPEQKRLAVIQEQVSRTGVLLGRGFPIAEPGWMQPLEMTKATSSFQRRDNRHEYAESDTLREGDWFSSRSVQAHFLETVRPSRAAIEVFPPAAPGQPPSVLSNVESSLKILFIVDDDNGIWQAEDVGTGEKKAMKPSTRAQFDIWMRDGPRKHAGPVLGAAMNNLGRQTGYAFAEAGTASKFAVPTLASVRWTHDQAIIAGPYIKR